MDLGILLIFKVILVFITFKNTSTSESRRIRVFVTSRVSPFGGSVKWHNNDAIRIPALKIGTSDQDAVQVVTFTLAPNASATYALTTSTAGSLSTPRVIAIQTLAP
ncbi:hypothetical protein JJQ72_19245 [Paenibacillus sp. F411]|uniref:hypothetical protein n=1 Tax=Paenibacillus sp. F411 TaxID=2820239 RepID=UPI001AAE5E36|nr:hypothetical protein [Paenibacillus sp. F411]MBO2946116.1 hypothetical protein [Paenibacillus sp. F411]